jgi:NitT/TauT family transport system permease protein
MKFSFKKILVAVTPNGEVSKRTRTIIAISQIAILLAIWSTSQAYYFPSPLAIFKDGFVPLQHDYNFLAELITSFVVSLKVTFFTAIVGLLISYLVIFPLFSGIPFLTSKGRFLSLVGLIFIVQKLIHDSYDTKIVLLVFGMVVYFVTSMMSVIKNTVQTPEGLMEMNHARTMRMNSWEVFWEVIVVGKMDIAMEILRQNFAIVWTMLVAVETIAQSGGGVGVLLFKQQRTLSFEMIFAIQISVMTLGILMDIVFVKLRAWIMPYSAIQTQK